MRRLFSSARLLVFMIGVFIGCQSSGKTEQASQSPDQTNGANVAPKAEGAQHQYRALCIEKDQHGGNEYVLSKWMDSHDKADEIGKYHGDFKYKGHRWRIEERVKSEHAQ